MAKDRWFHIGGGQQLLKNMNRLLTQGSPTLSYTVEKVRHRNERNSMVPEVNEADFPAGVLSMLTSLGKPMKASEANVLAFPSVLLHMVGFLHYNWNCQAQRPETQVLEFSILLACDLRRPLSSSMLFTTFHNEATVLFFHSSWKDHLYEWNENLFLGCLPCT